MLHVHSGCILVILSVLHHNMYKYKYLHSGGKVVICAAVSLICWALWPCGCQSDTLGFVSCAAVNLICWALWPCGCQSDMLGFVAVRL